MLTRLQVGLYIILPIIILIGVIGLNVYAFCPPWGRRRHCCQHQHYPRPPQPFRTDSPAMPTFHQSAPASSTNDIELNSFPSVLNITRANQAEGSEGESEASSPVKVNGELEPELDEGGIGVAA